MLNRLVFLVVFLVIGLNGQGVILNDADKLAQGKQYNKALEIYTDEITRDPQNIRALLGRANVYSWLSRYPDANKDFNSILQLEENNIEALTGLAYSYAWSGKYEQAEIAFRKASDLSPDNQAIEKGIAYTALWNNNNKTALKLFKELSLKYNNDAESHIGLTQANIASGYHKDARLVLKKVESINPNNPEIANQYNNIQKQPAFVETSLWTGYTNTKDERAFGLRHLDISTQPTENFRFFVKYDNSLSLDNRFLQLTNTSIPTYSGGTLVKYNDMFLSKLEIGYRDLKNNISQLLYQFEQVIYTKSGYNFKGGVMIAPREDRFSEWFGFAGLSYTFFNRLSLEPTFFHSGATNISTRQSRFLLNTTFHFDGLTELNGGFLTGSNNLKGVHMLLNMPLGKTHWWQFMVRYESFNNESVTTAALGLRFRLEK